MQEYNLSDDATGVNVPTPLMNTTGKKGFRSREELDTDRNKMDDQAAWQLAQSRLRTKKPTT